MLLAVKLNLQTNDEQYHALKETVERAAVVCNGISKAAFDNKVFSKRKIQKQFYSDIREAFDVPAQMVIRCIAAVGASYKLDKTSMHRFRPTFLNYDARSLSIKGDVVSILTLNGRVRVPFVHREGIDISKVKGGCVLTFDKRKKRFYLSVIVDVPETPSIPIVGHIGIDRGVKHLAHLSIHEHACFGGGKVEEVRQRFRKLRKALKKANTKSAKRHLIRIGKRESRFKRDVNHCISKTVAWIARGTNRAVVLEDLSGIRSGNTVSYNRDRNDMLSKWSFYQLQQFLEYKCKRYGVPVFYVDAAGTSTRCWDCGYDDKQNRNGEVFKCLSCGFEVHADFNGALNIESRGAVNHPIAVCSF